MSPTILLTIVMYCTSMHASGGWTGKCINTLNECVDAKLHKSTRSEWSEGLALKTCLKGGK